jgi:hypothetical protein
LQEITEPLSQSFESIHLALDSLQIQLQNGESPVQLSAEWSDLNQLWIRHLTICTESLVQVLAEEFGSMFIAHHANMLPLELISLAYSLLVG